MGLQASDGESYGGKAIAEIEVLWITAGLGCDGDTIAMTAATQPSIQDVVLGALPWIPKVNLHNPFLAAVNGDDFLRPVLVIEGSIPNEHNKAEGYWASFGTDTKTGQPILTCDWIDSLAPKAWAVMAAGTCATYGGIHAMEGNPTGCMGLPDYLGWQWKSKAQVPIVCVPGCPVQPDNFMETLLYLLHMAAGRAPMIPLDDALRPTWLFGNTVDEGCDRGGFYEQAQFAEEYGSPLCIVKLGCWGPVVQCNVGKRGWMGGIGGCPNVGGICIGCTMPGFPDKFMPFMNQPPGSLLSSAAVQTYGRAIHALRRFTQSSLNKEPGWRRKQYDMLDEAGFLSAARWYVEGFAKRSGIRVASDIPETFERLPSEVEVTLFRVLQAALTNVHRHSESSTAEVHLGIDDIEVSLQVRDHGRGISPEVLERFQNTGTQTGVGLSGMRERVTECGGRLEIRSESQNTIVSFTIPLSRLPQGQTSSDPGEALPQRDRPTPCDHGLTRGPSGVMQFVASCDTLEQFWLQGGSVRECKARNFDRCLEPRYESTTYFGG